MLREPEPGDWLMFRRTYDGWGYSPLSHVDASNVSDLRLAWVWSMEDGRNQPTPLVHDGAMFLVNPAASFKHSTHAPATASGNTAGSSLKGSPAGTEE